MQEEKFKQLSEEEIKIKPPIINLPEQNKEENNKINDKTKIITDLPSWNIEPPIEIKRGN